MSITLSQRLKALHVSGRTVFTASDIRSIWKTVPHNATIIARRMQQKQLIIKLVKGYYALNFDYNKFELANLIVRPSYVSFNSALFHWGVCFQQQSIIRSVALINYEKSIQNVTYPYHAMKKTLFYDLRGVVIQNNISIASPERALVDTLYFGFLANVDNASGINFTLLKKIMTLYPLAIQKKIGETYGEHL